MDTTTTTNLTPTVKSQTATIVRSQADVRGQLAKAVSQAACQPQQFKEGLITLVRSVMEGAREGLASSVSPNRDDVLRQVVDALGDGLSEAALAGQLTLEEMAGASRKYANEDLVRFRTNLTTVRDLFAETIGQGLKTCKDLTTGQIATAKTHAERVAKHLGQTFSGVLDAIDQHPIVLAREGLQSGARVAEYATGSLFQTVGNLLQRAGEELRRRREPHHMSS
jgi:hypothetical protein